MTSSDSEYSQPSPGESAEIKELNEIQTGTQFGGYEIFKEIGHGAMSRVFAAKQVSMERIVALKILQPSMSKNPLLVQQFVKEAVSSGKLDHENIVKV